MDINVIFYLIVHKQTNESHFLPQVLLMLWGGLAGEFDIIRGSRATHAQGTSQKLIIQ